MGQTTSSCFGESPSKEVMFITVEKVLLLVTIPEKSRLVLGWKDKSE